tara:strand:+ start:865 stop:1014 length:150 start_codon:yes stop_codon:yes gene_type:complete
MMHLIIYPRLKYAKDFHDFLGIVQIADNHLSVIRRLSITSPAIGKNKKE